MSKNPERVYNQSIYRDWQRCKAVADGVCSKQVKDIHMTTAKTARHLKESLVFHKLHDPESLARMCPQLRTFAAKCFAEAFKRPIETSVKSIAAYFCKICDWLENILRLRTPARAILYRFCKIFGEELHWQATHPA